jgi:hypothetical protein
MKRPGPPLEEFIDHLILIPDDFMVKNDKSDNGMNTNNIAAIANDLLFDLGGSPFSDDEISKHFPDKINLKSENYNYLRLVSVLCYLYEYNYFIENKSGAEQVKSFLISEKLKELSKAVKSADEFITDPERREEICRVALNVMDYYPEGENEKNAMDRLSTLDSVERKKILAKTGAAQQRARELKEAMRRKEAEEAASKMSRE